MKDDERNGQPYYCDCFVGKKEQKIEEICYNNGLRAHNFVIYLFVCSFIIIFFFADVLSLAQRNAIENHYADVSQSG